MGKRVNKAEVEKAFSDRGYTLLSEYKSGEKLDFICPNGHQSSILWGHFRKGVGCGYCAKRKIDADRVYKAFESAGFKLLGGFEKSNIPIAYVCPKGHEGLMTWNSFRAGCRCVQCAGKFRNPSRVQEAFKKEGYKLLSEYEQSAIPIKFECPSGHRHQISWSHFKKGHRCGYCSGSIITPDEVLRAFANEGYRLLDTYEHHKKKMRFECPSGHYHSMSWNGFQQGTRCGKCVNRYKTEHEQAIAKEAELIRCSIKGHLRKLKRKSQQKSKITLSKASLGKQIAQEIYDRMGSRPEGHQLDHIVPASFFDLTKEEEILLCWHVENLRYLPSRENLLRNNRLKVEEVRAFSQKQKEILVGASRKPVFWETYCKFSLPTSSSNVPKRIEHLQLVLQLQASDGFGSFPIACTPIPAHAAQSAQC